MRRIDNSAKTPKCKTAGEIRQAAEAYFRACRGQPILDGEGQPMRDRQGAIIYADARPPTLAGLALAVGLDSRRQLLEYRGRKELQEAMAQARLRVEEYAEGRLYDKEGRQGAEFNLRHSFQWDRQEERQEEGQGGVVLLPPVMEPPEEERDG